MHQERQYIQSMQAILPLESANLIPLSDQPNAHTDAHNMIAMDLTGQFHITSGLGHHNILVCFVYDCSAILTMPHQPLDNKASAGFKSNLCQKGINFQLVPPHSHRRNAAKHHSAFKNHFVAVLCRTDKSFQLHLWCCLLPQVTATLNLLRTSCLNPRLLAKEHLNDTFDFNRTPLAPLGTKVVLHKTPQQRRTWAPHGVEGWYVGYAPEQYQCYTIHVTSTNKTPIGTTVKFFQHTAMCHRPRPPTMPHPSSVLPMISLPPASLLVPIGLLQLQALRHPNATMSFIATVICSLAASRSTSQNPQA
jgi:hypothetical protein